MNNLTAESVGYKQLSASANICSGPAALAGILVSSNAAGATIAVYDDAGTGTTNLMVAPVSLSGTTETYIKMPFRALKGLYIVITGAAQITVGFMPETTK